MEDDDIMTSDIQRMYVEVFIYYTTYFRKMEEFFRNLYIFLKISRNILPIAE